MGAIRSRRAGVADHADECACAAPVQYCCRGQCAPVFACVGSDLVCCRSDVDECLPVCPVPMIPVLSDLVRVQAHAEHAPMWTVALENVRC